MLHLDPSNLDKFDLLLWKIYDEYRSPELPSTFPPSNSRDLPAASLNIVNIYYLNLKKSSTNMGH